MVSKESDLTINGVSITVVGNIMRQQPLVQLKDESE